MNWQQSKKAVIKQNSGEPNHWITVGKPKNITCSFGLFEMYSLIKIESTTTQELIKRKKTSDDVKKERTAI